VTLDTHLALTSSPVRQLVDGTVAPDVIQLVRKLKFVLIYIVAKRNVNVIIFYNTDSF